MGMQVCMRMICAGAVEICTSGIRQGFAHFEKRELRVIVPNGSEISLLEPQSSYIEVGICFGQTLHHGRRRVVFLRIAAGRHQCHQAGKAVAARMKAGKIVKKEVAPRLQKFEDTYRESIVLIIDCKSTKKKGCVLRFHPYSTQPVDNFFIQANAL